MLNRLHSYSVIIIIIILHFTVIITFCTHYKVISSCSSVCLSPGFIRPVVSLNLFACSIFKIYIYIYIFTFPPACSCPESQTFGFPQINAFIVTSPRHSLEAFALCIHVSWLPLRLGDVLVDDVAGEALLFFLLPHEQDALMNKHVLFLRIKKEKKNHLFDGCN